MDPGRFHRSRGVRMLWLGTPPLMLVAMSALALGYEWLIEERFARLKDLTGVLPALEAAQAKAGAIIHPLRVGKKTAAESEYLHAKVSGRVRDFGLILNGLAIDRHEEQTLSGAERIKVSISVDGSLEDHARMLASMHDAEPLLIAESARWVWLKASEDGVDLYRGEYLLSLYRVKP